MKYYFKINNLACGSRPRHRQDDKPNLNAEKTETKRRVTLVSYPQIPDIRKNRKKRKKN